MAIDYMEIGISKGTNVVAGVLSGYLTKMDMTATVKPTKFFEKKANQGSIALLLGGLAIDLAMGSKNKMFGTIGDSLAASGATLLGRSMYFELMAKDFNTANPGISEFPAGMTMVPHARGVPAGGNFSDQPGADNIRLY